MEEIIVFPKASLSSNVDVVFDTPEGTACASTGGWIRCWRWEYSTSDISIREGSVPDTTCRCSWVKHPGRLKTTAAEAQVCSLNEDKGDAWIALQSEEKDDILQSKDCKKIRKNIIRLSVPPERAI